MVVVDANVLVYAVNADAAHHAAARDWLDSALLGGEGVGLPWESLLAYLRLVTNPRVVPRPQPATDACAQIERWLGARAAVAVEPTPRHVTVLAGLLREAGAAGNLVPTPISRRSPSSTTRASCPSTATSGVFRASTTGCRGTREPPRSPRRPCASATERGLWRYRPATGEVIETRHGDPDGRRAPRSGVADAYDAGSRTPVSPSGA